MAVIGSAVDPSVAVTAFLDARFAERDIVMHVGVTPPSGKPVRYILLNPGGSTTLARFTTEHLVDVVVYDEDAVDAGLTAHLVQALLLSVCNTLVETPQGPARLHAGRPDFGPVDYDDPDVPLFGRRLGVRVLMSNSIL